MAAAKEEDKPNMDLSKLETRLKTARDKREETTNRLDSANGDLKKLIANPPKRKPEVQRLLSSGPGEKPLKTEDRIEKLDQKLVDLEKERTQISLPLQEEKQILYKVFAVEKTKRHEEKLLGKRNEIGKLLESRKSLRSEITELQQSVAKARIAEKVGCEVDELITKSMACPEEKLANVIGKKGANIDKLEASAKVTLDVDSKGGKIIITGSESAIEMAEQEINRIILETEEPVDFPPNMLFYLTSKHINTLADLRKNNPNVYFDAVRDKEMQTVRGTPQDIEQFKESLRQINLVTKERPLTSQEALVIIGKKGATIDRLVKTHEAAMDVKKIDDTESIASVIGPASNVESMLSEVEELLDMRKDVTEKVMVNQVVRQMLLNNGGKLVKEIQKQINEKIKGEGHGTILINFEKGVSNTSINDESTAIISGRNAVIYAALDIFQNALKEAESKIVRLTVDPFIIPPLIGKDGENIKKLKKGKHVTIEVDRGTGLLAIGGTDLKEVEEVKKALDALIAENKVERIPLQKEVMVIQFREFVRTKERATIRDLNVRLDLDEDKHCIRLRGKEENIPKASDLVRSFLENNYIEEVEITDTDKEVLKAGGSKSIIAKFAKELGVTLSAERDRQVLQAKGTKEKVQAAMHKMNIFLNGGDGNTVSQITVPDEALGLVIGKGGKKRQALERDHPGVSIHVHRSKNHITIRGPEEGARKCYVEILKVVASARVEQKLTLTEKQMQDLEKSKLIRRITQTIPVQCTQADNTVKVRGTVMDVRDAVALIMEHKTGIYESRWDLEFSQFLKVQSAARDASHFSRMKETTGATISLDKEGKTVVIRGKRGNVKKAKFQVVSFLEFILGSTFTKVKVAKPLHSSVGQTKFLADIAASTGATLYLDRDLNSVFILASNKEKVQDAVSVIKAKISESEKLMFVLEISTSEAWLIPAIIGKNGKRVNDLQKETGCNINVSREERIVIVSGTKEEAVAKAKESILAFVGKSRKEIAYVEIPNEAMPTFVGRSGAHIDQFSKKHKVDVQSMRGSQSRVRIQGKEEDIESAKTAIAEWISNWEETSRPLELEITEKDIPAIIGKSGSTIRSLQEESGCRIEIDRKRLVVTVRGPSSKRDMALEKVKAKVAEERIIASANRGIKSNRPEHEGDQSAGDDKQEKPAVAAKPKEQQQQQQEKTDENSKSAYVSPTMAGARNRSHEFPSTPIGLAKSKNVAPKKSSSSQKTSQKSSEKVTKEDRMVSFNVSPAWDESSEGKTSLNPGSAEESQQIPVN